MEINFCEYLINIGLINKESFSNLIIDYHKKCPNENFINNMKEILLNFLNNLSEEDKKYISNNLAEKYFYTLLDKKIEKLRIIYFIIKEKLSLIKLRYLLKWKLLSFPLDRSDENTTIQSFEKIYNTKIFRNRNMSEELYNYKTMKINNDKNTLIVQNKKKKIKNIEKCTCRPGSSCTKCGGTGYVAKEKTLKVRLPKGFKEGQKVRLKGEGKTDARGNKGDLFLVIKLKDKDYKIEGSNLVRTIDLTPAEAVLGCKKDVQTPTGIVSVKIPSQTNSGKQLRLKGLGIPSDKGSGDLNVKINISLPNNISNKEIDLYKQILNLENNN